MVARIFFDRRMPLRLTFVLVSVLPFAASVVVGQSNDHDNGDAATGPVAFPENVQQIFREQCWKCHAADSVAAGLDLSSVDGLLQGADSGPVIDAEQREQSLLLKVLAAEADPHMPPMEQLDDDEIRQLKEWVRSIPASQLPSKSEAKSASVSSLLPLGMPGALAIDTYVSMQLANEGILPAPRCTDQEFVRRLYLDLTGRIPTVQQAQQFLDNRDSGKREQLVDQLLASPEHARYLAQLFDAMLMGRKERKRGERKNHGWYQYLTDAFAQNRPWDQLVREVLLARSDGQTDSHLWYLYERDNQHQEIAESVAKGFFGVDIACAQCHDHPLASEIKQSHYWGLVAFFKRSKNENVEGKIVIAESAIGGFDDYANALKGTTDSSMLTFLQRETVPEERPEDPAKQEDREEYYVNVQGQKVPVFSRREKFVDEILEGHPLLAKAMVNRLWGLMMGRGLVHPIDRLDSSHPASHPELLEWLSRQFENDGYDVRAMIRSIVTSQAYQRSSQPSSDSRSQDVSTYAVSIVRPLPAEAMLGALEVALGTTIPEDSPVARQWRDRFPEVAGENALTDLSQSLSLSNSPALNQLIQQAADRWEGSIDRQQLQQMVQTIFVRSATEEELDALLAYAQARQDRTAQARAQILWALITSAEFRFNH